jgi:hypothetical protein
MDAVGMVGAVNAKHQLFWSRLSSLSLPMLPVHDNLTFLSIAKIDMMPLSSCQTTVVHAADTASRLSSHCCCWWCLLEVLQLRYHGKITQLSETNH